MLGRDFSFPVLLGYNEDMKKYVRPVLLIIISLLILFFSSSGARTAPSFPHSLRGQPRVVWDGTEFYPITHIVDGDTLDISRLGERVRIRLIGIDSPESVDPHRGVQCFGKESTEFVTRLLLGKTVRVETDPSQDMYDKYGRLLAYVYLPDGTLVNREMISGGYAREYTFRYPYRFQANFAEAEHSAREDHLGLWATTTCAIAP